MEHSNEWEEKPADSDSHIERRYYSIADVAEMLDVNQSVLRYWEKEFPQLSPRKGSNGKRLYTQKDLELVRIIHYLLKVRKFTVQGAREKLKMNPKDLEYSLQTRDTLLKLKIFLEQLRETLKFATPKIGE